MKILSCTFTDEFGRERSSNTGYVGINKTKLKLLNSKKTIHCEIFFSTRGGSCLLAKGKDQ